MNAPLFEDVTEAEQKPKSAPRATRPKALPKAPNRVSDAEIKDTLVRLYALIGAGLIATAGFNTEHPNFNIGNTVIEQSEDAAKSLIELSHKKAGFRKLLERLATGGAYQEVISAHLPIVLAVVAGYFPNAIPGIVSRFMPQSDEGVASDIPRVA